MCGVGSCLCWLEAEGICLLFLDNKSCCSLAAACSCGQTCSDTCVYMRLNITTGVSLYGCQVSIDLLMKVYMYKFVKNIKEIFSENYKIKYFNNTYKRLKKYVSV